MNKGNGSFEEPKAAADVKNDGMVDIIIIRNSVGKSDHLLMNEGDGSFKRFHFS